MFLKNEQQSIENRLNILVIQLQKNPDSNIADVDSDDIENS